jgi:hypothetical protein
LCRIVILGFCQRTPYNFPPGRFYQDERKKARAGWPCKRGPKSTRKRYSYASRKPATRRVGVSSFPSRAGGSQNKHYFSDGNAKLRAEESGLQSVCARAFDLGQRASKPGAACWAQPQQLPSRPCVAGREARERVSAFVPGSSACLPWETNSLRPLLRRSSGRHQPAPGPTCFCSIPQRSYNPAYIAVRHGLPGAPYRHRRRSGEGGSR